MEEAIEYACFYGQFSYLYEIFLGEKVEGTTLHETFSFDDDVPF